MPVKRAADAVVAGTALVVLSPLLGLLWIAVRAGMGRPILFRQERVTMSGRRFSLMKFRTMRNVDPARGWVTDEERLTRFGAWLRSTSLDELPSLWNILVGDMSVVGPRPLPTGYLPFYSAAQNRRHTVRAGLTGLAQASGRNSVPWDERFDLDQRYVLLVGPLIDLTILARTVRLVLRREGVVAEDAETTDFSGPLRTSRLRLVPVRGASGGRPVRRWEARTPADIRIARCACVLSRPRAGARAHATLSVTDLAHGTDPQLVEDLVALLITHARAADARSAQIDASADDANLLRALEIHGFVPARNADAGTVRLVTAISSLDEPLAEHSVSPLDVVTTHLSAGHPVDAPLSSPLASGAER
jgi:lipopolysaccharide/colanic/teichoic acid biosynthesis glycosyltransferase